MKYLLALVLLMPSTLVLGNPQIERVYDYSEAVRKRPFNWYYPYNYEYYYPRHGRRNNQCDWIYTQNGYYYRCY